MSLWLAIDLPALPLEALTHRAEAAPFDVVLDSRGPRRWIVAGAHPDISAGMDWSTAQAMLPTLRARPRDLRAEKQTLDMLCTWAWRFGSEVTSEIVEKPLDYGLPRHQLAVRIDASLKLFGGLDGLLRVFDTAFADTGHVGHRGVATTLDAAVLLARAGDKAVVMQTTCLREALAPLRLSLLDLPPAMFDALRSVGLRRIGELLALPLDGLARRHGPGLVGTIERLLGMRADGRPRHRLAPRYSRRFDLGSEVETVAGLEIPLHRLAQDFAAYLLARDSGVQEFGLTLEHARRRLTRIDLRMASATRITARLHRALRERLERECLPGAIRALRLSAQCFVMPAAGQKDLFDPCNEEDWLSLLETLSARLGSDAVHALATAEDCRPERSWKRITPETTIAIPKARTTVALCPEETLPKLPKHRQSVRPLWLIEPPRQLATAPAVLTDAERIEGGWWDGEDVTRDYYGARLGRSHAWVFQDRYTREWYLHGLFA